MVAWIVIACIVKGLFIGKSCILQAATNPYPDICKIRVFLKTPLSLWTHEDLYFYIGQVLRPGGFRVRTVAEQDEKNVIL